MSESPSNVFGPDLRTALIAMVRKRVPESEVEDIVQATLADAIESPHAPTDSESLRRWIFGVAKNKVVDYHRRAGRETFEVPEVAGKAAPHVEADLLRWAEKHLPPGEENKTTLDWMLREGEGEKLEWIAEADKVPAPRVRQRVSRLRRHLKTHWQKEVALLAALGVLVTIVALVLREKEPEPIANEDLPRAAELRKVGIEKCLAAEWKECVDKLDAARALDPAGDTRPEVRQARENAGKALTLPPAPTNEDVKPAPAPTSSVRPEPSGDRGTKEVAPSKTAAPTPTPIPPTPTPIPTTPAKPAPKGKASSTGDSWFDGDTGSSGSIAPRPATTSATKPPASDVGIESAGGSGAEPVQSKADAVQKKLRK
ncbi:MAG: sigma-70 family RNA polymerase sigma factor [Labilithrix sp.]|nr:sigma-70 family RNA polymerase sigma factor [Labilithrix sp.]